MKLANYLKQQNLSIINFAALIQIGYNTVTGWIRGKAKPCKASIERVAKATGNKVTAKDWVKV